MTEHNPPDMPWHVLGAGSIGCLWAGYLATAGYPVTLLLKDPIACAQFRDTPLALENATGERLARFADTYLFLPMQITDARWWSPRNLGDIGLWRAIHFRYSRAGTRRCVYGLQLRERGRHQQPVHDAALPHHGGDRLDLAVALRVQPEPVRPAGIFRGIVNADARPGTDKGLVDAQTMILDPDRAIQQAAAGERRCDTQRLCDGTRARQQRAVGT